MLSCHRAYLRQSSQAPENYVDLLVPVSRGGKTEAPMTRGEGSHPNNGPRRGPRLCVNTTVSIFHCCCNTAPQTQQLKTTHFYSLPVLQVRGLTPASPGSSQVASRAALLSGAGREGLVLCSFQLLVDFSSWWLKDWRPRFLAACEPRASPGF